MVGYSLDGLVFKILNFTQSKGTAVPTYMFGDVHLSLSLSLSLVHPP